VDSSGIIFAALDCDTDAIEAWNRWYDLEHLPPNIALSGITNGRRYVAPPELHEVRIASLPGFSEGRGVHVTVYTLGADPAQTIADMTELRDRLEDAGRMFAAEKKIVRAGDALRLRWTAADPLLRADDVDVPYLAHSAIRVVLRRGGGDEVRDAVAVAAVGVQGVHAVLGFTSALQEGVSAEIYLLEGDPDTVTRAARKAAPYGHDVDVLLDAPFQLIVPFDYSFADRIRQSHLPQCIAEAPNL
jgi:hypothetical protein